MILIIQCGVLPSVCSYSEIADYVVALADARDKVNVSNSTVIFVTNEISWENPDHFFRLRIAGYVCGGLFVIAQVISSIVVPILLKVFCSD